MAVRTISGYSNDEAYARTVEETVSASRTFTAADSGKTFNIATDALVMTLPLIDADFLGVTFTFRNTGADGNNIITLAPNALDAFHGTIANAAADSVSGGAVDKDFVNTKATSNKGDYVTVVAQSATDWYITGGVGIWASQA